MKAASRSEARRQLQDTFQEALRRARDRRLRRAVLARPPRDDEQFAEGVAWPDRLAETDRWRSGDHGDAAS